VVWAAVRSRGMVSPEGTVGRAVAIPKGAEAIVRRPIEPLGSIYLAGEEWSARSADGRPLDRGAPVRVVRTDGLTAIVEPVPSPSSAS
ncbi:MAG TPA: NfeD family protein, partial [Methylomirabilota bacterium]|nr:NfeD family protein [Methylomirabilota bacterium]